MNLLTRLTLQTLAGIISLAGTLVVVAVVIFLILTSDKNKGSVKSIFFKTKDVFFWGTCLLVISVLFLSLRLLPAPAFDGKPDEVVTVVGVQWDWLMSVGLKNQKPKELSGTNEISVPLNKRIKFIITSTDVTHSFGIYDKSGTLLTQTQAMPDYYNELEYVFTEKGKYTVLCLEYCGLAHAFMSATIHVY